jgi:hypothetical protein
MSRNLVSIGKGLEAKPQKQDSSSTGSVRSGDKKRASGSSTSIRSLSSKSDNMSRKDLLAGLPNVKKTPTLSEWTELLDSKR